MGQTWDQANSNHFLAANFVLVSDRHVHTQKHRDDRIQRDTENDDLWSMKWLRAILMSLGLHIPMIIASTQEEVNLR